MKLLWKNIENLRNPLQGKPQANLLKNVEIILEIIKRAKEKTRTNQIFTLNEINLNLNCTADDATCWTLIGEINSSRLRIEIIGVITWISLEKLDHRSKFVNELWYLYTGYAYMIVH